MQMESRPLSASVEGDHTYFVADGQGSVDEFVWVHNACPDAMELRLRSMASLK